MPPQNISPPHSAPTNQRLAWAGVLFALIFPSVVTWAYFFQAAGAGQGAQQAVMATLKVLQFAFPAVWAMLVLRDRIAWRRPLSLRMATRGMATGLAFGIVVSVAGWLLFHFVLASSPAFVAATEQIRSKVASFGIDSVSKYAALAVFYSLAHSFLEEYYWRWFVFGQLRRMVPLWPAIVVSALGFTAHHVLVLSLYFGWWTWPTLLLSAAIAVGGACWAWLYDRTGSLVGPWLSHLVIDAGIFFIGYQLVRGMLS